MDSERTDARGSDRPSQIDETILSKLVRLEFGAEMANGDERRRCARRSP